MLGYRALWWLVTKITPYSLKFEQKVWILKGFLMDKIKK